MSRNMNDSMNTLFQIFEDKVRASGEICTDLGKKRWIQGDGKEVEWLQKAKILKNTTTEAQKIIFNNSQIVSIYEYNEKKYLAIIGFENINALPDFLNTVPINAGIFTAIVSDFKLKIHPEKTALEIINSVLLSYEHDGNDYKGHDFNDLRDFFPVISLYEISEDCPFSNYDVHRLFALCLCLNQSSVHLPFTAETLSKFTDFLLNPNIPNDFPFENILLALTASHFKFAFLDIYRCLERLYSYIAAQETHRELDTTTSLSDFVDILEKNNAWKAKETNTIESLFEKTTQEDSERTAELTRTIQSVNPDINIGKYIYNLRNSIVHLRKKHEHLYRLLDSTQWNALIPDLLPTIAYWSEKL